MPLHESEVVEYVVPEKEMQKYDKKSQKGGLKIGHCWAIRTRMREFVISSDTTEDRSAWIEACEKNSTLVIYDDGPEPKQVRTPVVFCETKEVSTFSPPTVSFLLLVLLLLSIILELGYSSQTAASDGCNAQRA